MPYIKKEDRLMLAVTGKPKTAGELNFMFTQLAICYIDDNGKSYQHINDVLGALEGAKLEFYRRLVAPYENKKIAENGDVYP